MSKRTSERVYAFRLNSDQVELLNAVIALLPDDLEPLRSLDAQQRDPHYQGGGRPPSAQALVLRRALELGLPLVQRELEGRSP